VRVDSRSRHRVLSAVLAGTLVGLALSAAVATSAGAATSQKVGYVRLAHLSPDTPDVDVYLASTSHAIPEKVFHGVGYGVVSPYLALPVGTYSVSMRASGADPSTPPVLTATVTVASGHAYTVAGVGTHAELGLRIIADDLTRPTGSNARIRVVQASVKAQLIDVSLSNGDTVADKVAFAKTTPYRTVSAGTWTLDVKPSNGGTTVPLKVTLRADSVYSLLVLDGKSSLTATLLTDATRTGQPASGPIDAGAGGTAPGNGGLPVPVLLLVGVAAVLAVATVTTVLVRRRATAPDAWMPRRAATAERTTTRVL
jgi:hypothetical protein